jgi:hypothetical protein
MDVRSLVSTPFVMEAGRSQALARVVRVQAMRFSAAFSP